MGSWRSRSARRSFPLPSRERFFDVHADLERNELQEAESPNAVPPYRATTLGPVANQQRTVVQGQVENDGRGDLKLEPAAQAQPAAPGVDRPLVAVHERDGGTREVGRQAREGAEMVARLEAQLLQDGEPEEVRRIHARELVRAPDIPGPARAIADAQREPPAVVQDAAQVAQVTADTGARDDRLAR